MLSLGGFSTWLSASKAIERDERWREQTTALAFAPQASVDDIMLRLGGSIEAGEDEHVAWWFWALHKLGLPEEREAAALILASPSKRLYWSKQAAWWALTATRRARSDRLPREVG